MDIASGETERVSGFKIGQKVKAHIGGSSAQSHLPDSVEGVISEINGSASYAYVFTIKGPSGFEYKPYYSNQLDAIKSDKQRIQELESTLLSAIELARVCYDEDFVKYTNFHELIERFMSVLTEDKE